MKGKLIVLLIVLAIAGAAGGIGWWWWDFYQSQQRTHVVGQGPVAGTMFSGIVRCSRRTEVPAEVDAVVRVWHVEEGQVVQPDQPLVSLDDSLVAEDCASAEAAVDQAKAYLQELEAGPRPEELQRVEQDVARATAEYNHAVREYNRFKETEPAGGATSWEVEVRKTAAIVAKAVMDRAKAEQALLAKGTRAEQIEQAQARLRLAEAHLARCNALRSKYTIRAGHAGKITKTFPRKGELVTAGQTILLIHDFASVEVDGHCPESLQARVQPGGAALVQVDAFPGMTFEASVKQILPRVDEMRGTVTVQLTFITPPEIELPHGGTADITLLHDQKADVVRVPIEAVEGAGEHAFVWLQDGGGFRRHNVTAGKDDGKWVEILRGLQAGQIIRLR